MKRAFLLASDFNLVNFTNDSSNSPRVFAEHKPLPGLEFHLVEAEDSEGSWGLQKAREVWDQVWQRQRLT